ncbi:unnamed protein product [Vitrella brassicaformis CCMP3155]|uniref:Calcineurin-like phosphoesterase domain-containing protein n=1 Tax=Vitrella brassicaformis (strain CCMP3155) TaxID=1169540 RepID=A0A0G4E925_VITBC|nr:unnamed protein product [Vitrella brassicaformis CCMP3155]|eukprot:CEL92029.1 unnamed protein product [Vitrella brassicaformis CCMP3155]
MRCFVVFSTLILLASLHSSALRVRNANINVKAASLLQARVAANATEPEFSKIRVVSDMHLGSPRTQKAETLADVRQFFQYHAVPSYISEEKISHIVFLGDVFEAWLTPLDEETPTIRSILTDPVERFGVVFPEIIESIKKIAAETSAEVWILRGNHDDRLSEQLVRELFGPSVHYPGDFLYFPSDSLPLVKMQHGHFNDIFNRPDPLGRPSYGEYVSRCQADHYKREEIRAEKKKNKKQKGFAALANWFTTHYLAVKEWIDEHTPEHPNWIAEADDPFALPVYSETVRGTLRVIRRSWLGKYLTRKFMERFTRKGFPKLAKTIMLGACEYDHEPSEEELKHLYFTGQMKYIRVLMRSDRALYGSNGTMSDSLMMYPDKSMWSIIQDYALLPGQFANQGMSEDYIKELLIGSTANQEYFVCSEKDATVTVMGHTHDHYLRKFQKYDKGQEQIVYANSGAWTDSSKKTFVDIIMARNKYGELPIRVELHKWNKGAPKLVASQNTPNFELSVGKTAAGSPSTPRSREEAGI